MHGHLKQQGFNLHKGKRMKIVVITGGSSGIGLGAVKALVNSGCKVYELSRRGKEVAEQINILGDDGVPVSYHEQFWKSELIDFVILQQDAFDRIDAITPLERQRYMLELVLKVCDASFNFDDFDQCRSTYKNLINTFRQMNYSEFNSEKFNGYLGQINKIIANE